MRDMETGFMPNTPPITTTTLRGTKRRHDTKGYILTPSAPPPSVKDLVRISEPIAGDQVYRASNNRRSQIYSPKIEYHPYLINNKQSRDYQGYTDYVTTVPYSKVKIVS